MKLSNVFVGMVKDKNTGEIKEKLLYKRVGYYDIDRAYTEFIDLDTFETFDSTEIDLESLIPFSKLYEFNKKRMRRKKVKRIYHVDRDKIYNLKDLVYGDIYSISKAKIKNFDFLTTTFEVSGDLLEKDALLLRVNGFESRYVNFKANTNIDTDYLKDENNVALVDNVRPLKTEGNVTKRLIIEQDYNKRL